MLSKKSFLADDGRHVVLHSVPNQNGLCPDVRKEVTVAYTSSQHVLETVTGSPRVNTGDLQ